MRNGPDVPGGGLTFTDFSITTYSYLGDNVSKVLRHYGTMSGDVFGTVTGRLSYEYFAYDEQVSPFTLLPDVYKISRLLSTTKNDKESLILSPNNPKRWSATDLTTPIPTPIIKSTNYVYDPQTYMTKGYGVNYIYKPQ